MTEDQSPSKSSGRNLIPGSGTGASSFGGALAVLYIVYAHMHGTDYPAGAEAAIAVVISTVITYLSEILSKFGLSPP
jgi:hypothetical protein